MMSSQALFIPLYFDEAEADLWSAVQQIEPEKRSSFIKRTLRQALLDPNRENPPMPLPKSLAETLEIDEDSDNNHKETQAEVLESKAEEQEELIETISLESLFAQTCVPHQKEGPANLTGPEEAKSIPNRSPGFEYMMKHIIGIEEDEEVLKVISRVRDRSEAGS